MDANVSFWGIVLATISAMVVGTLWYSPAMFGKQWSKITGVSEKEMKQRRSSGIILLIVVSIIVAYTLTLFINYYHGFSDVSWVSAGIHVSLLAGIGFGATAVFAHGVFETRSRALLYINAGNRIVTIFIMGLIISAFLK